MNATTDRFMERILFQDGLEPSSGGADKGTVRRLSQEVAVDQQPQHVVALMTVECPEPACLRRSEAQAGHFEELASNAFEKTA
jgi:hypothetical protein